jgi:hypothetical protein
MDTTTTTHDTTAVAVVIPAPQVSAEIMEQVLIGGDLAALTEAQRLAYYRAVCQSLGLNPLSKPFEYLWLNGKLRLYALRDCADQLRRLHGISIYITNRERLGDLYIVTARTKDRHGREDESTGAVALGTLKGDALANALMKAKTKAKRRVTLSLAGLGWLDETELDTIPGARTGAPTGDHEAGEIMCTGMPTAPEAPTNGQAPPPVTTPTDAGLPCAGQVIADLKPAQLAMLVSKTARLVQDGGDRWVPFLAALQAERAGRLDQGRKTTGEG